MAWTAPRTWVALENVSASIMNAHVRDNLAWLKAAAAGRGVASGTVNFTSGTTDIAGVTFTCRGSTWVWMCHAGGYFSNSTGANQAPILAFYINGSHVAQTDHYAMPIPTLASGSTGQCMSYGLLVSGIGAGSNVFSIREINSAGDGSGSSSFNAGGGANPSPLYLSVFELTSP